MSSDKARQELITIYRRRLQNLEKQNAVFGYNTRPEIRMEIEDIQEMIKKLEQEADQAQGTTSERNQDTSSAVTPDQTYKDRVASDKVLGDVITVGNVLGTGIAIGRGAYASATSGSPRQEMGLVTSALWKIEQHVPVGQQAEVADTLQGLKVELEKGYRAEDRQVAKYIERLVFLAPTVQKTLLELFDSPPLNGLIGPVTGFVLERIEERTK